MLKKNKKRITKRNNNKKVFNRLSKTIYPVSQKTEIVLTNSEFISTVNGSPEAIFGVGNQYYNVSDMAGWTDFTEQSDSYLFCRFKKIVLDIVRTTDEATMVANLRGGDIYLNYYPHVLSTTYSYANLSRDTNSYRIDPMTFDEQQVTIIFPDYLALRSIGNADYWINLSKPFRVSDLSSSTGEIVLRTSNTSNNGAVVLLFKIRMRLFVEFSHRL